MISGKFRAKEQTILIVGTKTDLGFERAVSYEEALDLAHDLKATYVEVSSAINTNVDGLFAALMDSLIPKSAEEDEFEELEEDGIQDFIEESR